MAEKKKLIELLDLEEVLFRRTQFLSDISTFSMEDEAGGTLKAYATTITSSLWATTQKTRYCLCTERALWLSKCFQQVQGRKERNMM